MPDWTELLTEAERRLQESFSRFHLEAGQPLPPEVQDALLASEEALRTVATLRALVEEKDKALLDLQQQLYNDLGKQGRAICRARVTDALALTEADMLKRLEEKSGGEVMSGRTAFEAWVKENAQHIHLDAIDEAAMGFAAGYKAGGEVVLATETALLQMCAEVLEAICAKAVLTGRYGGEGYWWEVQKNGSDDLVNAADVLADLHRRLGIKPSEKETEKDL